MIEIQQLGPDDWRIWRQLRRAALAEAPEAFGSTLAEWSGSHDTEDRWRARLTNVPFNAAIRWCGTPAGMVGAHVQDSGTVELISLWVAPSARGRGIGDAAIGAVLDWADGRAVVLSVKAGNRTAIGLYRRHGFTDAGPSPDGTDERRMLRSADVARRDHIG